MSKSASKSSEIIHIEFKEEAKKYGNVKFKRHKSITGKWVENRCHINSFREARRITLKSNSRFQKKKLCKPVIRYDKEEGPKDSRTAGQQASLGLKFKTQKVRAGKQKAGVKMLPYQWMIIHTEKN